VRQVRLDQDDPFRVEAQLFEEIERHCKVGWVDSVAESILVVPLPGQGDPAIDPIVRWHCALPVLVRVLNIPCECAGLDHS